jgi:hypothetical protein
VPHYLAAKLLNDPWGNGYKYLQLPEKYLLTGSSSDGRTDPDLFLQHGIDSTPMLSSTKPVTGGIQLID